MFSGQILWECVQPSDFSAGLHFSRKHAVEIGRDQNRETGTAGRYACFNRCHRHQRVPGLAIWRYGSESNTYSRFRSATSWSDTPFARATGPAGSQPC